MLTTVTDSLLLPTAFTRPHALQATDQSGAHHRESKKKTFQGRDVCRFHHFPINPQHVLLHVGLKEVLLSSLSFLFFSFCVRGAERTSESISAAVFLKSGLGEHMHNKNKCEPVG